MLLVPAAARAQTQGVGGFVSVNGLFQAGGDEVLAQSQTLSVYGETGTTSATQEIGGGSGIFDIGAGFRVKNFGLGLTFTGSTNTNTATVSGSIPHPFLFDRPRTVSTSFDEMEHKERVVHVQAYYFVPLSDKAEVALFVGPSFYRVTQDYVTGLGAFTESADFATVSLPVSVATAKESQLGYNIGAEASYWMSSNVGAAALLRFTRASVDLDLDGALVTLNVGDIQIGGGIRFRF
jgi:hypothetical protein